MNNLQFVLTGFLLLIPIIAYSVNKKFYYYSLIVIYSIVGQSISVQVDVFGITLNPSMLFGLLILTLAAIDFIILPTRDRLLDVLVIVFIGYAVFSCAFSPTRFDSLSWTMKIATWLLILLVSSRIFNSEKDFYNINIAVSISVLIVLFSFMLSRLGYYGESFTYETGVESYGGGYSTGKILAYYLTMALPILAIRTYNKKTIGRPLTIILMLLSAVVIFLTFVRSPVISLLVGFLAYQYFSYKYGAKSLFKSTAIIFVIAVVIITLTLFLGKTQYMSRWSEMGTKYSEGKIDKLGSGRVGGLMSFYEYYFYKASAFKKIVGSGLGSSYVLLGNKKVIHNDFAEILMGCGVIGFSIYMLFLARVFSLLLHNLKISESARLTFFAILAASIFFIFLAFHMTNVTSGIFIISLWSIFTGAAIGKSQSARTQQKLAGSASI
jgi:hypothetical protein